MHQTADHDQTVAFLPYAPIERHGLVGDRRTAALVAGDGTIDWMCLPDYDGPSVFGALLDADRGGFWRLGPAVPTFGRQRYLDRTALLRTTWTTDDWELELTDAMVWPQDDRSADDDERRVLIRRLRCTRGEAAFRVELRPRHDFDPIARVQSVPGGVTFETGDRTIGVWLSVPVQVEHDGAQIGGRLGGGTDVWAVMGLNEVPARWSAERAAEALAETAEYWHEWQQELSFDGPRAESVRRSAQTIHLLSYAPAGSLVAAPTTSLPERIGGDRNYDYRYAWIRDASLSLGGLSMLGDTQAARRYMDWLGSLGSSTDSPLQVVYRVCGCTDLTEHRRDDLAGYRGSRPIRRGNRAFQQRQLDSLGYLAHCIALYLDQGGYWCDTYWQMVRRLAAYTSEHWHEMDSGIWELPDDAHYVSSKVMSWVCLERSVRVAELTGHAGEADAWRATMDVIHAEVMERGWSAKLGGFRERYDAESLDASALLIPLQGFLPADHPRVLATIEAVERTLTVDGLVHRFLDAGGDEAGGDDAPTLLPGDFEGAFVPATCWLATAHALAGHVDRADAILDRIDAGAGALGLLPEEIDARSGAFLGNAPLVFSHGEYLRAALEVAKARRAMSPA